MGKIYEKIKVEILVFQEDVVKTSAGADPFDDGFTDFGENN